MRHDHAAERGDRHLGGAAADVDDERADGVGDGKLRADRRGERLLDQVRADGTGPERRLLDRRRSTWVTPLGMHTITSALAPKRWNAVRMK